MLIERITLPSHSSVTLTEAKGHLRQDLDHEDVMIADLIAAAETEIELYAQIALVTQTVRATYQGWPDLDTQRLSLPIGPVPEDATALVGLDGAEFTDFTLHGGRYPALTFTEFDLTTLASAVIVVDYTVGFGDSIEVPADLKTAVKEQVLRLYDQRGGHGLARHQRAMSPHAERIAQRYKRVTV